jgi:hypothetical protein
MLGFVSGIAVNEDVAVLIQSESASSSDADVDNCIAMDNVIDIDHSTEASVNVHPCMSHVHTNEEPSSGTATVPPTHPDDDVSTQGESLIVLNTCAELLRKLEAVRVSVLHLQYSMHAGELGVASVQTVDRSRRLWSWGNMNMPPMTPIVSTQRPQQELEEGERLSQDAISAGIHVFNGCCPPDDVNTTDDLDATDAPATDDLGATDGTPHADDAAESGL